MEQDTKIRRATDLAFKKLRGKGMTFQDIAEAVGTTKYNVRRWKYVGQVSPKFLSAMAEEAGMTVVELRPDLFDRPRKKERMNFTLPNQEERKTNAFPGKLLS